MRKIMARPEVSIIVTNYNYSKYLARCVRSCLDQHNVNCEVIVVDDCSVDNSMEVLEPFKEEVKTIRNKKNMGVAVSSNLGIKVAKSQYVIRVDADDFINSETCYFMKSYLEANHDAFGVACDYVLIDNHEDVIERKYAEKDNISCGIMYRRDLLLDMGGYNPKMRHREEEELRKRLGDFYNIHYLKMPFYRYRMHNNNKTKNPEYKTWEI
jgi:glycosyltransferase involved in cell wall biosynthesis